MHVEWGYLASLMVGFVTGACTLLIGYWLTIKATAVSQDRERKFRALYEAYGPAHQAIMDMLQAFPNHAEEREFLRKHLRDHRMYFDPEDVEHLTVAQSDTARLDDLISARELLRDSMVRKMSELGV